MPRFIADPSLPKTRATHVAIAASAMDILASPLAKLNVSALPAPQAAGLPLRTRDHSDMNMRHLGGGDFVIFEDAEYNKSLYGVLGLSFHRSARRSGGEYKSEAALNMLVVSGYGFHKPDITDPLLKKAAEEHGITLVDVNQGYTACSVAVVDESSLITADAGIAAAAEELGFDVLRISPGFITLPGYSYGFIGGACGKLSTDKMAFTGSLDGHPDKTKIISFLAERGVEPVFLTDGPCFDCGGIVPLAQL